jgi:hypothetical protein
MAVCVATLPGGAVAHTRYLCKRLRARLPSVKLLICRWGSNGEGDDQDWAQFDADYLSSSFAETIQQLDELAQFLRPVTLDVAATPTRQDEEPIADARIDAPHLAPHPSPITEPATAPAAG